MALNAQLCLLIFLISLPQSGTLPRAARFLGTSLDPHFEASNPWHYGGPTQSLPPDSEFFDVSGYYHPLYGLTLRGYYLNAVGIQGMEPRYGAHIELETGGNVRSVTACAEPLITRDTVDISCPETPVGELHLAGRFVDKRGKFWNRDDVKPDETVVLVARVTVTARRKVVFSQAIKFTYFAGD